MANGSAVHDLSPGLELRGRYKVLGPISSGAMGAVYRAADDSDGTEVGGMLKQSGRPGLPVENAIDYVRQTAEALQYVHEQQIVHRDVKPQNLIVGHDGVVLVDFGVAARLDSPETGT